MVEQITSASNNELTFGQSYTVPHPVWRWIISPRQAEIANLELAIRIDE